VAAGILLFLLQVRMIAIITFLLFVWSEVSATDSDCIRERKYISIDWPGCEPTSTKVPTCHGTCESYDVVIPTAPYFQKDCTCCKSEKHIVRKRQLPFSCNGRVENHTVFLPIIEKCNCIRCQVF
jgi:hypothetical protein